MDYLIKTFTIITILALSFHLDIAQDKLSESFDVKLNAYVREKLNAY